MDYLTPQNKRVAGDRDPRRPVHHGQGQARHHHRRRRHRRRLPGDGPPPGGQERLPVPDPPPAARGPACPTTPGRSGRTSSGPAPRTRRGASASSRSTPAGSSASTARSRPWRRSGSRSTRAEHGRRARIVEIPGTEKVYPADLILLAIGYTGPDRGPLLDGLGVELDDRGNVKADPDRRTNVDKVFVAGDMSRGQSLIVWAIAEGRHAAQGPERGALIEGLSIELDGRGNVKAEPTAGPTSRRSSSPATCRGARA